MKTLIHQTPISKLKLIKKHKTPFSQIDGITIDNERTNSPSIEYQWKPNEQLRSRDASSNAFNTDHPNHH